MFNGMLLTLTLAGLTLWLLRGYIQTQIDRAKKQNAATFLEAVDGKTLKRLCGNVNLPAWIRYPDCERAQWLNDLVAQLWPNAEAAAAGIVRNRLDPLLKENKPAWINDIGIHTFALGNTPPRISAVKVFSTESVVDEVGLELEVLWDGAQRFQLVLQPFPRILTGLGLGAALSKVLQMRVGVGSLWIKGTVRVAMKPLLDRMPLVGAVKVSLVDMPEFSFSIQLQGGDVTFLPGLELWLTSFIKETLLQPYVLPEGITFALDPSAGKVEVPKGILFVKVLEARNLPWLDWLTLPDPYVLLFARGRKKRKTKICRRTFQPRWDEEFLLLVHEPEAQELHAVVYDSDLIGADKEVGHLELPIRDLQNGEVLEDWHDLELPEMLGSGNAIQLGVRGVRSVGNVVRDAVHLPFIGTGKGPPQLKLQLRYHPVGEEEVRAATEDEHEVEGPGSSSIVQMLKGGALIVTVKKGSDAADPHSGLAANMVTVEVAGQTKGTAATEGQSNPDWEETLEFAVGGDAAEDDEAQIEVRVWDYHWVDHLSENLSWDVHTSQKEGQLRIPLRRVIDEGHIDDTFRLENVDGDVDLELRWVPLLDRDHAQSDRPA